MTSQPIHSPVVLAHMEKRAADTQLKMADAITKFAGSMKFVYIHAVVFAVCAGLQVVGALAIKKIVNIKV